MNKAKIRGAVCPSCGRDNRGYGNICTADDCPGVINPPAGKIPCPPCGGGAELDFHFTPVSVGKILKGGKHV
jgi:hypothetical protein